MPFAALHTIELQIVMQHCELEGVLRLAQCNHFTLQAASAEFAFRCTPPIELCSLQPNLAAIFAKSLVRSSSHLGLRLLATKPVISDAEYAAHVALLKAAPPLYSFDCLSMPELRLDPLLSSRSLRSLRVLSLRHDVPFDGVALQSLSHLRELTLQCGPHWHILESLVSMPSLATLNLELNLSAFAAQDSLPPEAFVAVGECVSLRSLSLRNMQASQLQLILSSRMQSLTSLTIMDLRMTHPHQMQFEPPAWCACLSLPPQLRRIEFVRCWTMRKLLHHLTSALDPQGPLREVLFHPKPGTISGAGPAFIREFLQRLSLLTSIQFETPRIAPHRPALSQASYPAFVLRSRESNVDRYASRELVEQNREALQSQLQELMVDDHPRLSIVECAVVVPREDTDRELLERFAPKQRGCCIA